MTEQTVSQLPVAAGMTVEQLWEIPDDGLRRELIDGELFVSPAPIVRHQLVLLAIYEAIRDARPDLRVLVAPVDVHLDGRTNVQPDLVVYDPADDFDIHGSPPEGLVPLLLVEVSSPSTRRTDLLRKRELFERHGVPEYWFADLDAEAIDVHVLADGRYGRPRTATGEQPPDSGIARITETAAELLS